MTKKLKPCEDASLFEYEPNEDEVSDEEMCEIFYAINKDPEDIFDKAFKKVYLKYLEAHKK
ncbi:MAG: hypothetical protein LUQ26_06790 [Methylococcaceae bacterium]|nr:hypothetical protein [Methylococcaceae bacterium]